VTRSRRSKKIGKLTARASKLSENQYYDLVELSENGFVLAKATGNSITHVSAHIESLIYKKLG